MMIMMIYIVLQRIFLSCKIIEWNKEDIKNATNCDTFRSNILKFTSTNSTFNCHSHLEITGMKSIMTND